MKKLLLLSFLCAVLSCAASAQVTYLADTAFTTDIGYDGAAASCVYTGGSTFGWLNNRIYDQWVADVFTVPAGSTWTFDTVIVYGYLWGAGLVSQYTAANLELYNGAPGLGGSVIWGDTATNVLLSSGWTGIYRVSADTLDNAINDTDRPIMYLKLYLDPAPVLPAGSYWLAWSTVSPVDVNPVAPPKVLPGRVNPPAQQARRQDGSGNPWGYMVDNGNDMGMNKIIKASASVTAVSQLNTSPASLQNAPNPFSTATNISFFMQQAGPAKLEVYNAMGQLVSTLANGVTDAGWHTISFSACGLTPGVYYCRLSTAAGTEGKAMVINK